MEQDQTAYKDKQLTSAAAVEHAYCCSAGVRDHDGPDPGIAAKLSLERTTNVEKSKKKKKKKPQYRVCMVYVCCILRRAGYFAACLVQSHDCSLIALSRGVAVPPEGRVCDGGTNIFTVGISFNKRKLILLYVA